MKDLATSGNYNITSDMRKGLDKFYGGFANEKETADTIRKVFDDSHYLIDTHTAVAAGVYFDYRNKTGDDTPTVIASTASPYKFTRSVLSALDDSLICDDDFEMADRLSDYTGTAIPGAVTSIRDAKILHDTVCSVQDMKQTVLRILS